MSFENSAKSVAQKYSKTAKTSSRLGGLSDAAAKAVETRLRRMDAKDLVEDYVPGSNIDYIEGGRIKSLKITSVMGLRSGDEYEVEIQAVVEFKRLVLEKSYLTIDHGVIPLDIYTTVDENGSEV